MPLRVIAGSARGVLLRTYRGVLAYDRIGPDGWRRVLANFGDAAVHVEDCTGLPVGVGTDRSGERAPFSGELSPVTAVVLSNDD